LGKERGIIVITMTTTKQVTIALETHPPCPCGDMPLWWISALDNK